MKIIGIAGGSGAGKSSVAYHLVDEDPDRFEMLNFDDYHKWRTEPDLPMMHGMINWDHPDIILWDELIADLYRLKAGQPVTIGTWSHRSNVDYMITKERVPRTIVPRPVIIVEGYLLLHHPELLGLFDKTYYLELDESARLRRRDKEGAIGHDDYTEKVLIPMHHKYVEPTKSKADVVIDIADKSVAEICQIIKASM